MPTTAQGLRSQAVLATNREVLDVAEGIHLLNAYENPATYIFMMVNQGSSGAVQHNWFDSELQPTNNEISGECSASEVTITVDNIARYAIGDVCMVENSGKEVVFVTAVSGAGDSAGQLTVIRDYGQGDSTPGYTARAAIIADTTKLKIIGNAFEQGFKLPTIKNVQEVQYYNFCQTQRTPYGVTDIVAAAKHYGENDLALMKRSKAADHTAKVENQNLWGVPAKGDQGASSSGTGNDSASTAGGLYYYISAYSGSDRVVNAGAIAMSEFMTFLEAGFEYGSKTKILLCPPILRTAFDTWGLTKMTSFTESNQFGIAVEKWVSAHGTIKIITHKMLTPDAASDGATAFLIDLPNVKFITYSDIGSTREKVLDPYGATGETAQKGEFQTISCLEMRSFPTHGMLYNITSVS